MRSGNALAALLLALSAPLAPGCLQWGDTADTAGSSFELGCRHAAAACADCHTPGSDPAETPRECIACHLLDRPADHDPERTTTCERCHRGCTWEEDAFFHPEGFAEAAQHGQAMKLQDEAVGDCRECHGADLTGGDAVGCDDCHADGGIADWRTDCVLCHGGILDATGAPPLDIDDESDPDAISSPSHPAHAAVDTHAAIPCAVCHVDTDDILDPGHIFDGSPDVSEVQMATGTWNASGTCTNWCHGNGRSSGSATDGAVATCSSCHAGPGGSGYLGLSGEHARHMQAGGRCADCHYSVVNRSNGIIAAPLHVDHVTRSVMDPSSGITWNDTTCSGGRCHGVEYSHTASGWTGN